MIGNNMFAYGLNNPSCMADHDGEDAVYVVTTGTDGIPVVGHAILFLQDSEGNWYKTHYTGTKKKNAKVHTYKVSESDMQSYFLSKNVKHIYISGDFSDSYELAQSYNGSNYGGYNLFSNNCLHYVKELLKAGSPEKPWFNLAINGREIRPMSFYKSLVRAQSIGKAAEWVGKKIEASNTRSAPKGVIKYVFTAW